MESHRSHCFSSSQFEGIIERWRKSYAFCILVRERLKIVSLVIWKKEIPEEVWDCGSRARVLDVSENLIRQVPARISSFGSMHVRKDLHGFMLDFQISFLSG